ncbi:hypothetical protein ACWKWJ_03045 [Sphingopyxis terrae subsp. ummariensis]
MPLPSADTVDPAMLRQLEADSGEKSGGRDRKVWMLILYFILFGLYIASYRNYLAPYWAYMGFVDAFNPYKFAASLAIITAFVWFTPQLFSVRAFFLNLSLTVYMLPSLTIYTYADEPTYTMSIIVVALAVVYAVSAIPIPRFSLASLPAKPLMWFLAILTIWLLIFFYVFGGFRNFNLDIARVYEFRRDAADDLPGIFGYLISIFSSIIIPVGVVLSLRYRLYPFTAVFFFMSIMLFGFTSHKSILFYPFVITGFYIFLSKFNRYSIIIYIVISMLALGVASEVYSASTGVNLGLDWYNTLLIRRVLMIPPLLDYHYIEFFTGSPKYYWSSSSITFGLVQNYYSISAPNLIGEVYFSDPDVSANAGFIGSGFSQAGVAGVLLYAAGVGGIFSIFQTYGRYLGQSFVAAATVGQVVSMLRSADLLTMFLTHGLLVSLLLLVVISPPESADTEPSKRVARARPMKAG